MYYFYGIDWTYIVFMLPCLILSLICQAKVNSSFSKYSKIRNTRGMTGAQAAQYVLTHYGVTGVRIEQTSGKLSDHFDPRTNVIRLSESVYNAASVAAVGVACHEAGHAVQHATGYLPNKIRGAIVPAARVGSTLGWVLFLIGLFLPTQYSFVLWLGIIFFSLSVLFTVVTLPVEFDASRRALKCIRDTNLLVNEEYSGAKSVLTAAAMTYVAAAATAVLQLLRLILIANRRD
ncbi:MAG: zinc metallopeptidase [Oscillospiraceae bacterium]|nr:zinc metallopeptidase [Oscillospiraceae bacterium]